MTRTDNGVGEERAVTPEATSFAFSFEGRMKPWARLFRVTPTNSAVTLSDFGLEVRFGWWRLVTPWFNIVAVEATGPFQMWKVAGPARMSWSDRGITFATTTRHGVCLTFRDPVPAIDPLGLARHPNATITVDEPELFVESVRRRVLDASRRLAAEPTPRRGHGRVLRSLSAIWRWFGRDRSVRSRTRDVDELFVPEAADDRQLLDGQPISAGVGAWFHRRYLVSVRGSTRSASEVMAAIQADPNILVDAELAPFTQTRGDHDGLAVGDRLIVETAGPWSGPVEVTEVTDYSFRLSTLDGHMEAGMIEFAAAESADELQFTIESWNRSAHRSVDIVYDHLQVAQDLQSEVWVQACERIVALSGGHINGSVDIETERASSGTNRSRPRREDSGAVAGA